MQPIKAIITDVDGVMVGGQEGVNFPLPHTDVIQALRQVSQAGVPIVLCTAKYGNAIKDIAIQAGLNNPHITDGGAVVVDWLGGNIIAQQAIDPRAAHDYIRHCLEHDQYIEIYTNDGYYVQASQKNDFTESRSRILQEPPHYVDSLLDFANQHDIIKLWSFAENEHEVPALEATLSKFAGKLSHIWTQHPTLMPRRLLIITQPGVSKQHAAQQVTEHLGIGFDSILGIGDTESDWNFMQRCGYVATIGSETGNLKSLSKAKGAGHYYFASSVDDHGLLEVFRHFKLTV